METAHKNRAMMTLQQTKGKHVKTANGDTASITVGCTEQALRNNGSSTSLGQIRTKNRQKEKCSSEDDRIPRVTKSRQYIRSHLGGSADQGVTGDKKDGKGEKTDKLNKATDRMRSPRTGKEKTRKKPDRERNVKTEQTKMTRTQGGGRGKRIVDGDTLRDSGVTQTDKPTTGTDYGTSTSQNHKLEETNFVDPPPRSDIGNSSRVTFLAIISKLFPLEIKGGFSTSSTLCEGSTNSNVISLAFSSRDDTLKVVESLESNFGDLVEWFDSFESTKARDVIGFDLAMELCGCYDLVIRRLGNVIREAFDKCNQSAQQLERADRALECLDIIKGDMDQDLRTLMDAQLLPKFKDSPEFDILENIIRTSQESVRSMRHIKENIQARWDALLEIANVLVSIIGKRCLCAKDECVQHHKELEDAKLEIEKLEKAKQIEIQVLMSQISAMREEYTNKAADRHADTSHRIAHIQALHDQSLETVSRQQKYIHDIAREQEKQRSEWRLANDHLREEIEKHKNEFNMMQEKQSRVTDEYETQIETLTKRNLNLSNEMSRLTRDTEYIKTGLQQELATAQGETSDIRQKLCDEKRCTTELKLKVEGLTNEVKTLTEELDHRDTENKEFVMCKSAMTTVGQFLGIEMGRYESVGTSLRAQMDASVERITKVLNCTCIRLIKDDEDHDDDDGQQEMDNMDIGYAGGQMFLDYESHIGRVIQALRSEPVEMEVTRRIISRTKCKRRRSRSQVECSGKKLNKTETRQKVDLKWNLKSHADHVVKKEEGTMLGLHPVQDHSGHSHIYRFNIDTEDRSTNTIQVPTYITSTLEQYKAIKLITLGNEKPITTLLSVLQANTDELQMSDGHTGSTCHCSQMEHLSKMLKCTLFIAWTPQGKHELYGEEYKSTCLYTMIVCKQQTMKSYYLLCVLSDTMYTYNLAKLPSPSHFQPPSERFSHTSVGECEGPDSSSSSQTIFKNVDTVDTKHIILEALRD